MRGFRLFFPFFFFVLDNRSFQSLPSQSGAFDAGREFCDAVQDDRFAEVLLVRLDFVLDQQEKFFRQGQCFCLRFADDNVRHHAGAGCADAAAMTGEFGGLDCIAIHRQLQRDDVAAGRVVQFDLFVGVFLGAVIVRMTGVVKNDMAV